MWPKLYFSRGAESADAVLHRHGILTYGALRKQTLQIARRLLSQGSRKGDRIGIFSENSPFFVAAYLGAIRAGMTAVPFQTEVAAGTLSEMVLSTGIRTMFVSNRYRKQVQAYTEELGLQVSSEQCGEHTPENGTLPLPEIDAAHDLAALMFTSGSTGTPKAVMVTHRNIESNALDIISYMGLSSEDRAMIMLPLHYCFGLSLLHTHLMVGGSIVLNNEFKLFPEAVLMEMQQKECTGLAGVPSTFQILLRRSRFRDLVFPRLCWFQQAGGKLPNPCIQELLHAFPHVKFFLMYGQTEGTARLSYLPPERLADKLGSIGRGLPSTQLEVLKTDGTPVAPGSGEIGEIVATGDNITRGYWEDPVETAKFFRDGKLHTGDLARVDSDGFIFIVERERDVIKSGGNRVSAKEIEDVIAELPEVVEVAVIGSPHELLGEAIKALVVPTADAAIGPREVETHCRRRLPASKVPEEVILLSSLIHNSSGKVLKQELRKLVLNRQLKGARDKSGHRVEYSLA